MFENLFGLIKDHWSLISAALEEVCQEISGPCTVYLEKGRPGRPSQRVSGHPTPAARCPQITL